MNFFEAFAGIGGFRIGLERVGFKCIGSCEIDKYASKLYHSMEINHKEVKCL